MNKYRIVPILDGREFTQFLQFRSTETKWSWFTKQTVECWRFVPNADWARVSGDYLFERDCPTAMDNLTKILCKSRFLYVCGEDDGRSFAKTWPDIYEYLKHLRELRAYYLKQKEIIENKVKNTEIVYL